MSNKSFIPAFNYEFLTVFYDFFVEILGFGQKERVKIVKLLQLKKNEKLLDLGCGTGSLLIIAKKLHPKNEMTGVDIDKRILQIAKQKIEKKQLRIRLLKTSADQLPFTDKSFDVAVSSLVFHHLPLRVKQSAIKEIRRVLKDSGRFLLVDFGKTNHPLIETLYLFEKIFNIKERLTLKDNLEGKIPVLLKKAGFKIQEVRPSYRGIQYLLAIPRT